MADFSITGDVRLNSAPAEQSVSKWTVAAGALVADFAKKAVAALESVVKSGITYNAGMESYLTNFKVMLGNEELAAAKLEELRRMAASTPFALSDLTDATQTLLQFGVAADDSTGVLQQLGDISLGNASKLQTLVRAYGKMSSAQKVTLENVNMMIDAGFNPLNQICDATGETMSDLYKRISDGKVGFDELQEAISAATSEGGQFYNGMLEASQTYTGRLSTLADNTSALLGKLSDSFYTSLSDLIPVANDAVLALTDALSEGGIPAMLETAGGLIESFSAGVIEKIPDAVSAISNLLADFLNYLAGSQDAIFDSGVVLLENLILGITDNLPNLITSAANLIARFAAALISHLPDILKCGAALLTTLVDGIIRSIENLGEAALACIAKLVGVWDGSMDEWGRIGENIVSAIISGIAGVWSALVNFVQNKISALVSGSVAEADSNVQKSVPIKANTTTDADRQRRQKLHDERVKQSQKERAEANAAASAAQQAEQTISASAGKAAASTQKAGSTASKAAAEVVKSVTSTATTVKDGVTATTETVNETLKDGTTQQKKTVTETSRQMVDGVLSDVKTITTTAADGSEKVTQSIEAVRDVVATTKDTQTAFIDGVKTTTETTTKTLADGSEQIEQVITATGTEVIDGVDRTVKTVTTIAADGTRTVAKTIEDAGPQYASAGELLTTQLRTKLDDGWKDIQSDIQTDALGAIESLANALKNGDLEQLGLWAASYFWQACTKEQQAQITSLAKGALNQLSTALSGVTSNLSALTASLVAKFVPAAASATAGQTALNVAMDANPILLVISLIGMLVGALVSFAGTNKTVANGFKHVWYGVEDALSFIFESILRVIGLGVQGFVAAINAIIDTYNTVAKALGLGTISRVSNPMWKAADKIAAQRKQRQAERKTQDEDAPDSSSKKVIESLTDTTKKTNADGSTTTTKVLTEKLQDESGKITTQVTKTITEAGKKLVNGVERSYKTVTTFVDGIQTKVETTLDDIEKAASAAAPGTSDTPGAGSTGAIEDNTAAILAANEKLAEMVRKADSLVLSDNMAVTRSVAASGTAQVAAAASSYHTANTTNITQNIYSKAQTAADLQREARWEADRAKAQNR